MLCRAVLRAHLDVCVCFVRARDNTTLPPSPKRAPHPPFQRPNTQRTPTRTQHTQQPQQVVERRVYTVTGQHMPEADIDRMIESGEAENIFQKAILEQGRGRVLDTLAEIQERHR